MKRCTGALLAGLLSIAGASSIAQTVTTIPTRPILNPPLRSPADVQSTWSGGINVVVWWLNGFGQQATRDDLRRAVERSIAEQKQFIEWTGQGVLLNARVITQGSGETSLRSWAVLGEGATPIGSGKTPEEALLTAWRKDAISAGIPDGWTLDQTMSTYIWVTQRADGAIAAESVPRGTMHELDQRVRENWAVMEARRFENELENLDAWDRVAKAAQRRLGDRKSRLAVEAIYKDIADSQNRVRKINEDLKAALEKARKAAETAQLIATLQGVLSVAQLTKMAIDGLNVPATEFSGQSTGVGVAKKVEAIRDGRVQYAAQLKVAFDGSVNDLRKFLDRLYVEILPTNPPPRVKDTLTVTTPVMR